MSTTPNAPYENRPPLFPGATAPAPRRHALGLPAGSVRAILALMVVGLICVLMLISTHDGKPIGIPAYLLYLLFMILGHFFAAHGVSISQKGVEQPPPLHLPCGMIRLLIIIMLGGTIGWELYSNPTGIQNQLEASFHSVQNQPFMPVVLLGGFFLGILVHMMVGKENNPYWFQDFEAWVALISVVGLTIEAMIHLVINPSLKAPLDPVTLRAIIAGLIAFYFGARS